MRRETRILKGKKKSYVFNWQMSSVLFWEVAGAGRQPVWGTAQNDRVLLRTHCQPVSMCAVLLKLVEITGFHHLCHCTFIPWSHLSYSHSTSTKSSPETQEDVKILFLSSRPEVWSLIVVTTWKNPVNERGMNGGHLQGIYAYCQGGKSYCIS